MEELLAGATPPGVLSSPRRITVAPGDDGRKFEDRFPDSTRQLGVIADYYRAPGDEPGERRQVVPARCGFRTPKLELAAKDLYLE